MGKLRPWQLLAVAALSGCVLERTPMDFGPGEGAPSLRSSRDAGQTTDAGLMPSGPRDGGNDSSLSPGAMCPPGKCEPRPSGATCEEAWQCESGHCDSGLCCAQGRCCRDELVCGAAKAGAGAPACYEFRCCEPRIECRPGECGDQIDDGCGGTLVCGGCDDGNPCTDDMCVGGACVTANNNDPCNDGLFCNGTDTCEGGECTHAGDPCSPMDGDADCRESCSEEDRTCTANDPSGTPCDDGFDCTVGDSCTGGRCRGRNDNTICDDGDMCTLDRCDAQTGCISLDNGLCK